jgi:hypothetical protein
LLDDFLVGTASAELKHTDGRPDRTGHDDAFRQATPVAARAMCRTQSG